MRCFPFLPFICGWFEPGSNEALATGFNFSGVSGVAASPQRPEPFTSWTELPALQTAQFEAIGSTVTYLQSSAGEISNTSVTAHPTEQILERGPKYTQQKKLDPSSFLTLAQVADGIDVASQKVPGGVQVGVIANPYAQGWNYQSFGVWNNQSANIREITLSSFGTPTAASAVPSAGSAAFVGKLGGLYVSPGGEGSVATANVNVNANFSARSLTFISTGTSVTRDLHTASAAPNLDLNGTFTYSPSSNSFAGTLQNAGGTMSGSSTGRYYGPTAQELGGVFTVKSPTSVETFAGAYGGKR
jgi:transferrin binding protein